MSEIDPAFIQPIEHRPKPFTIEAEGIPIIDLSSITSTNHYENERGDINNIGVLIAEIGNACEKWGFFQVINHGVPQEKLERLEVTGRKFFALPQEEKRKVGRGEANPIGYYDSEHTRNVKDWKHVFDFTAKDHSYIPVDPDDLKPKQLINCWPQSPPEFKEDAQEYARELEKLAFKLLELIALSLGLAADRLNGYFKDHASIVRLNYYPSCPSPQLVLGLNRHKDAGALTILAQDDVGGLQVRRKSDGEWVSVRPNPGAFIVNVGDIVQVWSNDKYESVEHRVMVNSEKERLSIPFFFYPAHYIMVKPLEETIDDENPPKYNEYNWGVYFATKRKNNFKKLPVENIQVAHFKIV
ncbi:protein DMR6-LIKE OXYGENASE 2-like [Chenopodium quinoa]|uniref:Fe2OG dioxygenase domain-containing protein n=1 Tax=Chenopodium quinoa TaxID=63459 RepID=A0A803LE08_CHEQI|nr:protein DMR6-LIKE OXYGENASE 2-like [Chenopodium quinoa]